jgi:predicted nucleotidyltransferase
MNSIEEAKQKFRALRSKTSFEKMVQVTAILTKLLEPYRIRPIIVGGLAVEIYTRSDYTTVDIDLIVSDRKRAGDLLVQLGFTPAGRHWYHEELMISIEIPNDMLEDADYDKVIELRMKDGLKVYVIGIEDIILDRLRACVHWKSTSDCEWGKRMFFLHAERLDLEYMRKMAKTDGTAVHLEEWIQRYNK